MLNFISKIGHKEKDRLIAVFAIVLVITLTVFTINQYASDSNKIRQFGYEYIKRSCKDAAIIKKLDCTYLYVEENPLYRGDLTSHLFNKGTWELGGTAFFEDTDVMWKVTVEMDNSGRVINTETGTYDPFDQKFKQP